MKLSSCENNYTEELAPFTSEVRGTIWFPDKEFIAPDSNLVILPYWKKYNGIH